MAIVTLYKVNYRYSGNTPKTDTYDGYVVAAAGSTDKALETLIKAAQPKGAANVQVTEVSVVRDNIIS